MKATNMRIALVSEHASPLALLGGVDSGGQNVHVAELARGLGRLGASVVVYTRRDDPALPARVPFAPNVDVAHVDAGPPIPLPKDDLLPYMAEFGDRMTELWRAERPDVVHTHFWMSGVAGLRAAQASGLPIAHTYHALGVVKRRQQGKADTSPIERLDIEAQLARSVDLVISTSFDESRELVAMGADPTRIAVIPCGVDLELFRPDGPAETRDRRAKRVVVVSRLVERKGIGNVITAVSYLPDVELVVAGGPPAALLDDDPTAGRFRKLIADLGIDDRVELRGAVPRSEVPVLMRSADVVCCCPWYEPFGLVAVEAMACGVPVVASMTGGLAETVISGQTGVLVPPRQPERIAEALQTLLADDDLRRNLGQRGSFRARRYSWDGIATETYDRLAQLTLRAPVSTQRVIGR